jgi:hypothetical protein
MLQSFLDETVTENKAISGEKASKLKTDLRRRLHDLKSRRSMHLKRWEEIAKVVATDKLPRLREMIYNRPPTSNDLIIDNTGIIALRTLVAGLQSNLVSPSKPWFKLTAGEEFVNDPEVKVYLSHVERIMKMMMSQSNFYEELGVVFQNLCAFGTGAIVILEDERDGIRCYTPPIGEFMAGVDNRNDVTVFYREYSMTAYAMNEEFGYNNLSKKIQMMLDDQTNLDTEFKVYHVIQRNKDFNPKEKGRKAHEYINVYWEDGAENDQFLRYGGFKEKPFCVVRWHRNDNDVYGRSPADDALGDLKHLQFDQLRKSQGIEKHVNPPMIADSSLRGEPASTLPNGVTYINNPNTNIGFKPIYQVPPDLSGLMEDIQDVRIRIERSFHTDLLMMLDRLQGVQPRSQFELLKREGEKITQMSPIIERLERELLSPCIDRVYAIGERFGAFPKPPESLQGRSLEIKYVSALSIAQKAASTASLEQFLAFVGNLTAVFPELRDRINIDFVADKYAEDTGVDPQVLIPVKDANQARQAQQQQMQQQQMMEQGLMGAESAKLLSETDVGGGKSALSQVFGMGGGMNVG